MAEPPAHPAIDVVIACFNDGATLTEAVRSVQAQERLGELVVVDDGSTDALTLEVFAALEREGVHVIHRANGGFGAARMTGVAATRAEYVVGLDADDRLLPGALSLLGAELDADPELSLAWGDYEHFGEHRWRAGTAPTLDPFTILYSDDIPATMAIRRGALLRAGGWDSVAAGYSDWDLLMSLAERGVHGRRIPRLVYEHRTGGSAHYGTAAAARHDELYRLLRSRHPRLVAGRRRAWLRTWRHREVPFMLRLALPVIHCLPVSGLRRRELAGAACIHVYGRAARAAAAH